ncbi:MAG: hypothetical protein IJK14_00155, partial [Clostridia bacterium]|nr:hypothetical protein [Clostridia bacterium]
LPTGSASKRFSKRKPGRNRNHDRVLPVTELVRTSATPPVSVLMNGERCGDPVIEALELRDNQGLSQDTIY